MAGVLAFVCLPTAAAATAGRSKTVTVLGVYNGKWGRHLVVEENGQKLSLFAFSGDGFRGPGTSRRYGRCQKVWRPLIDRGRIVVRNPNIDSHQVRTTKRRDGSLQISYWHQPLYPCPKNTRTAQERGANTYQFGGSWNPMGFQGQPLPFPDYGGVRQPPAC